MNIHQRPVPVCNMKRMLISVAAVILAMTQPMWAQSPPPQNLPSLSTSQTETALLKLSGYGSNDFNSPTTRTGITCHAFIDRA